MPEGNAKQPSGPRVEILIDLVGAPTKMGRTYNGIVIYCGDREWSRAGGSGGNAGCELLGAAPDRAKERDLGDLSASAPNPRNRTDYVSH